ncbi:MAG: hypothetical protein ACFE68_06395 [Candidatus Hodarchaeota archaeon]
MGRFRPKSVHLFYGYRSGNSTEEFITTDMRSASWEIGTSIGIRNPIDAKLNPKMFQIIARTTF